MRLPVRREWSTSRTARLTLPCAGCRAESPFGLYRRTVRVIVLVPLFAVSHQHYLRCERCWAVHDITRHEATRLASDGTP